MDVFVYDNMERFYSLVTHKEELDEITDVLRLGFFKERNKLVTLFKDQEFYQDGKILEDIYLELDRNERMLLVKVPRFRFFKKTVYRKKVRKIFAPMSIKKVYINGKKLYNPVTNVLHLIIF